MAKDDETGIESIAKEASKDPRMKDIAGDDAETETGETEDDGDSGIEDCLNEAFDKRNDRAGFVAAMKKAIAGY